MVTENKLTYARSGVDTEEADRFVSLIKPLVEATHGGEVFKSYGGFAGLYMLPGGKHYLVGATDGVGTKLKIAFETGKLNTVGIDLVAMCVNDILTCGAKPLFFLDYIATGKLDPERMAGVVEGIASGCSEAGCALLGGETAEMPGFYADKEFDLAGFSVGIVEKDRHISGRKVSPGDEIISLPSSGVHSNGYSLIRKALFEEQNQSPDETPEGFSRTLGDELLEPTKIYARALGGVFEDFDIHSAAHITGGGLTGNIPRSLPAGCRAIIEKSSWEIPPVFAFIKERARLEESDMFSVFNCGIGMTLTVRPADSGAVIRRLESEGCEGARVVGKVEKRDGRPGVVFI
ncbi:MAG: phosphoribosylformylglycinamidine cyclo-ligase [Candidatus Dadabacteria bacterium]|nr:phosphoribosylformylglycinamidine cyclo-ligase [Candidatus Dadabacteria bacterium]